MLFSEVCGTPPALAEDMAVPLAILAAALDERDPYTNQHCDRVSRLCIELGRRCGMDGQQLDDLALAARFHDIGKIGIPDAILHKPGRLDEAEMAIMKTHPLRGERLFLATSRPDADRVASIIRHHHEAWDGSGYPDGLSEDAIPLSSRILALADGYDAMVTDRPYRAGMSHERAMAILDHEAGKRLDPQLHATFVTMLQDPANADLR